ncbi:MULTISPECIES: FAD-dependent monooxygenase [Streptomyces]|uniref:FAD-dependent monooxygenase n=1 Tax=Streptomyces TaxID=1883 RepID=UPI001F01F918|nr:FAD-dependent monooxygenase [Streptomyces sp. AMCC400023]UJV46441.1 salicylate 1-monooxygenase [Streptomyces sp. AMCC400023]
MIQSRRAPSWGHGECRIAIVGAGIAGLTVALALGRAGIRSEVFEQTKNLREVGAGVQIAPNATRLLHRLGLERRLSTVAVRPSAVEMRRWDDGRLLGRTELGDACEDLYGAPYHTVHRADLHQALLYGIDDNNLHIGRRCVGVEELPDAVLLRFEDGSVHEADVVIGADGIHSVVRDALAMDEPRFSGQSIYRGLVPGRHLPFLVEDPKVRLWLGPDQHCVCYPVSAGEWISVGATAPAGDWSVESWTAEGRVEDLVETYQGWDEEVLTVLKALDRVGRWALHDRDPLRHWSTGRIAVVGDAAHPMLPFQAQGANQSIEDAVVLAGCLRKATRDGIPQALKRYEQVRRPRTDRLQQMSRVNARTFHLSDGQGQRERDQALAGAQNLREQEWLYGYDAESALLAE